MIVYCYFFQGAFSGQSEYEYNYPAEGESYKCILFLLQEQDLVQYEFAEEECNKYGFGSVSEMKANPLEVESINLPSMQKFVGYYEEALDTGSALAIYPNT